MAENNEAAELTGLSLEEINRNRYSGYVTLQAGEVQTRECKEDVRKVYVRPESGGRVKVTVRDIDTGAERGSHIYAVGEKGGPEGGNGVYGWGECVVEYMALEGGYFYYHIEWN